MCSVGRSKKPHKRQLNDFAEIWLARASTWEYHVHVVVEKDDHGVQFNSNSKAHIIDSDGICLASTTILGHYCPLCGIELEVTAGLGYDQRPNDPFLFVEGINVSVMVTFGLVFLSFLLSMSSGS